MAQSKKFNTPLGPLHYIYIDGDGRLNMDGDKYRFEASMILHKDSKELKEIESKVNAFWEENKPNARAICASNGIKVHKVDGVETDDRVVGTWTGTEYKAKPGQEATKKVIPVYDSKGKKATLPTGKKLGNGSIGSLGISMRIYEFNKKFGVNLFLTGIQIQKVEWYEGEMEVKVMDGDDGWLAEDEEVNEFEASATSEDEPNTTEIRDL